MCVFKSVRFAFTLHASKIIPSKVYIHFPNMRLIFLKFWLMSFGLMNIIIICIYLK